MRNGSGGGVGKGGSIPGLQEALLMFDRIESGSDFGRELGNVWRWVAGQMERFPNNVEVQVRGCKALLKCALMAGNEERKRMGSGAAPKAIAAAMKAMDGNVILQCVACQAIAAMAKMNAPGEGSGGKSAVTTRQNAQVEGERTKPGPLHPHSSISSCCYEPESFQETTTEKKNRASCGDDITRFDSCRDDGTDQQRR